MEPWQSWALVGAVGVGAAYYYSTTGPKRRARGRGAPVPEQNHHRNVKLRNDSKDKRRKEKDSGASDQIASDAGDGSLPAAPANKNEIVPKEKGGKKKQSSKLAQDFAIETSKEQAPDAEADGRGEDEGMSNAEFAKQLSSMKTGTTLKKPDSTAQTQKTRKQGKRNEALPESAPNGSANKTGGGVNPHDLSTTSSTTGADADDDLSSTNSPELGATQTITPSARNVSDMLEAPVKGPSVLRLTEPAQATPTRQPKQPKAAPEPETKKQRQHRQRNEEKKVLREQAEKERRALLEKQLRTAREAEGRPAKNGLGPSQGPSSNAWSKSADAPTRSMAVPPTLHHGPFLDTFDDTTSATSANRGPNNKLVDQTASHRDLPSEEEQMRILSEMDSDKSWSTVPKGGKAKKKTPAPPSDDGGDVVSGRREKKDTSSGMTNAAINNFTEEKTPTTTIASGTNGSITKEMGGKKTKPTTETKPAKATKETIDHSVWNRSNIHEHPDYDSDYPYALTGHPEDSDWAVA